MLGVRFGGLEKGGSDKFIKAVREGCLEEVTFESSIVFDL